MGHKDKKFVYHMTALENLPSIAQRGLLCRKELISEELIGYDVADPAIIEGRGDLARFVPFHFKTRNPFDYGVMRKPEHRNKSFVCIAVKRTYARAHKWKIIPKHPLADGEPPQIFEWDEGIEAVEWDQLDKGGNWSEDHHCKQACMAEALSPTAVPLQDIAAYFFRSTSDHEQAKPYLYGNALATVNSNMFPGAK